jgi:gliding motility-associated-like protein
MMRQRLLILLLGTFLTAVVSPYAHGQNCGLGQTPSTAFPVCGTSIFKQATVPACGGNPIPVPGCTNAVFEDINPYYYKFTCFVSGTLGFTITPNTPSDDYDWQVFDVTNHDPNDIYANSSLFVSGNWSGNPGNTGTANNNNGSANCAGYAYPTTNSLPSIVQGHDYLLMVSHFTSTNQSGYDISFTGGTASITDSVPPGLRSVAQICDGHTLRVLLNKKMKCSSLAADGSDFILAPLPPGIQVTGASANTCTSGFDLDTVILTLSGPLPVGVYTITAADGSDGNTLLDNCGNQITVGESRSFTMTLPQPTPLDSIAPITCAPNQLRLVFKKYIQCSSIAADGSDFKITGTSPVAITSVNTNCTNGLTNIILVNLSAPIQTAGNFVLTLQPGNDGNTLFDECGLTSPPSSIGFSTKDTVSAAALQDPILLGCINDTVVFSYPSQDGVNQWLWIFDNTDTSRLQNPAGRIYSASGTHSAKLTVSNGVCTDTTTVSVVLDNAIKASFEAPNIICPRDYATFKNNSTGQIESWTWDFADGTFNNDQTPPDHLFPITGVETNYPVKLIAGNANGCYDTATQKVDVLRSCYIAVPTAFTPNGDGLNDYLYPLNAFKADNLVFQVFNRQGQMVFETHDWTQKWDGRIQGHDAPAGTYAWFLQYTDRDSMHKFFQKGTSILIR